MENANEENQKMFLGRYLEKGIKLDYWWMDAGWYVNGKEHGWPRTGTWEIDTDRFPRGFRPITDEAHEKGVRIIVWFEPERVTPGTWLYEEHPDWLVGPDGEQKLLNMGNDDARQWLTDHVYGLLTDQGIDLYRQDFNIDPLAYWRANDGPDRQGATENHYVSGYLSYWDELRRRHPGLLIDSCASGGRRNDVETLRRAVPLLRSDYIFEPTGQQCHTYCLSYWVPFYGTGVIATDDYTARSAMATTSLTLCWDLRREDLPYDLLRKLVQLWRQTAPYRLQGDYYPLTAYSRDSAAWMGWQFDCPQMGSGIVEMFRRPDSPYEVGRCQLRGLEPEGVYRVRILGEEPEREMSADEMMQEGVRITIKDRPGAVTILYDKAARSAVH
jgi:alpha-galactosidase